MPGISMITALEIFTNPKDLFFKISEGENNRYGIIVCRGPGHKYKPLLTCAPIFDTADQALEGVKSSLEAILDVVAKELMGSKNFIAALCNPHGTPFDQSQVLTKELADRIMDTLKEKHVVETHQI